MEAPMNDYYTKEEYERALEEMYRAMERRRIILEAEAANRKRQELKKSFEASVKTIAEQTKSTISGIKDQMDTAIKGQFRDKIEATVRAKIGDYDHIV